MSDLRHEKRGIEVFKPYRLSTFAASIAAAALVAGCASTGSSVAPTNPPPNVSTTNASTPSAASGSDSFELDDEISRMIGDWTDYQGYQQDEEPGDSNVKDRNNPCPADSASDYNRLLAIVLKAPGGEAQITSAKMPTHDLTCP
jgi:hypothetical protein